MINSAGQSGRDDEIIAQLRSRQRGAKWVVLAVAIASVLCGFFAYYFGRGDMNPVSWWAVAAAGLVALAALIWLMRTPAAACEPRIVAKRTDEMQRSRARVLWLFPVQILLFAPAIVTKTQHILDRGAVRLLGLPRGIATTGY